MNTNPDRQIAKNTKNKMQDPDALQYAKTN